MEQPLNKSLHLTNPQDGYVGSDVLDALKQHASRKDYFQKVVFEYKSRIHYDVSYNKLLFHQ